MRGILVDSNVFLDEFQDNATWVEWLASALERYGDAHTLYINAVVYSEVTLGFKHIEELESALRDAALKSCGFPKKPYFSRAKPSFGI